MSSTMKISLLALASSVVAIPHYGANPHSKFHSLKASGTHPTGKPYPSGGWSGKNSTAVAYPAGTGAYDDGKTTTIDTTSTSTTTLYQTVTIKPSASTSAAQPTGVAAEAVSTAADTCGPATVTVTASEKITVTVTGSGAYTPVPASSSKAPVVEKVSSKTPVAEKVSSAAVYPAETPKVATTTSKAAVYSAATPVAAKSSSKVVSYVAPSYAQNVAASSTVASSATASATGNSYSGIKRGLAYNEASLCSSFGSSFGFGYNWGQVENNDIGTNFIPMMHKPSDSTAADWLANVDKAVKKGSTAVMGFNECDEASQCNLGVDAACTAWKSYMNPIKTSHPSVTIIGPSVTNGGETNKGIFWLTSFYDACPDAVVHANNIHFYDVYDEGTIDRFKAHVEKAVALNNKPVWVTEFGLNTGASEEQAAAFLKECLVYLDSNSNVQGYSYFMVGTGANQLNSGSGLSKVGEVYAAGL